MELLEYFARFQQLDAEDVEAIRRCSQEFRIRRGDHLAALDEVANDFYFLHTGIGRSYYLLNDREVTSWLAFEGQLTAAFASMVTGEPTIEAVQMIEDGHVTALNYRRLVDEGERRPNILKLSLRLLELNFLRMERRAYTLQCTSAGERLRILLDDEPHVLERVPHFQVASYLGITPETLSRIRSKMFQA